MAPARCPHCQTSLPEAATFCAACGRRIAGWSATPEGDANEGAGAPLPGGEEPTRQMEPSQSLLRAAAVSRAARKDAQAKVEQADEAATKKLAAKKKSSPALESDSALMRSVKRPRVGLWIALGLLGVGAGAGAFVLVKRYSAAPSVLPPVVVAAPKAASPTPPLSPVVALPGKMAKRAKGPRRVEPLTISAPAPSGKGGLPHKAVKTDSAPLANNSATQQNSATSATGSAANNPATQQNPPAAAAAKNSAPPPLPPEIAESTPLTDEEQKTEAEERLDADQVRFVVKQHIAQVHACYARAFKEESPGGRVELAFTIGKDGRVAKARTDTNSTGSELLGRCLEGHLKEWQFPRPTGGEFELIYPFIFAPGS